MADNIGSPSLGRYPFPEDNTPVEDKAKLPFNLQIARAIWMNNKAYGSSLFYNDRINYDKYVKYALGKQAESDYHPFLGLKPDVNDKTWMKAINFQIKNYATKRINILITKILSQKYDIEVDSIDPHAVDSREDMKARLNLYLEQKKWFESVAQSVGITTTPEGVSQSVLPLNSQDIDLFMELDYKSVEEIGMELGIQHHLNRNKYNHIRYGTAFTNIVLGVAGCYVGMDENMLPYIEWIDPGELMVPYSDKPNYAELPYVARVKWVTVQEFRKMAIGYLTDAEIEICIRDYSRKPEQNVQYTEDLMRYDNVNKIPILHYNYRSTDTVVGVKQKDSFGNKKFYKKRIDYYATPKEAKRFQEKYGKDRTLIRETYNTVYEGFWVLNSQYVFRYGPRSASIRKKGNLGEDLMGFKISVPNSFRGYITSIGAQMIPNLDELQRYNLKMQQLVARAIPKGIGIDLYALRKANLKWDNKDLSDQQKIEMFIRSGIFVFDSKDRYAPGSNYKPFYEVENGLAKDIVMYIELIKQSLFELDETIGLNRPATASPDAVEGKGLNELQIAQSDVALGFIYRADQYLTQEVVESLAILHAQSVKYGPKEYYDRIFGRLKTGVMYSDVDFGKRDYGFNIELQPDKVEWEKLYARAEKAYDKGIITFSDTLLLSELKSLKQARRYLVMLENKHMRDSQQSSMALQQQNADVQNQSINAKAAADKELAQFKHTLDLEMEDARRETLAIQADYGIDADLRIGRQDNLGKRQQIMLKAAEDRDTMLLEKDKEEDLIEIQGEEDRKTQKINPKAK